MTPTGRFAVQSIAALANLAFFFRMIYACPADGEVASVRFNVESDRMYLEGSGCITPSEIFALKNTSSDSSDLPIKAQTAAGEESDEETGWVMYCSSAYIFPLEHRDTKIRSHILNGILSPGSRCVMIWPPELATWIRPLCSYCRVDREVVQVWGLHWCFTCDHPYLCPVYETWYDQELV